MFIDETRITVSSGKGGDGIVSFRREKYVPKGGPDGGDGGRGGHVVLRADAHLTTLGRIQHMRHYRASTGGPGGSRNKHGRNGEDLVIDVPVGTLVRDDERGHVLKDLAAEGDEVVIAKGGAGGRGNKHFAHATNRTPRQSTRGQPSETRRLRLELRLVADVGLVGLPNAGKSTLLSRVSAARPKIADYPFTTLEPMLGLVDLDSESLVLADIPGLIDGAHEGAGLGDRFLRHVARTGVLLHLVDGTAGPEEAVAAWRTIRRELELSGLDLADKPGLLAVTKADVLGDPEPVLAALAEAAGERPLLISSATGDGLPPLLGRLADLVEAGKIAARGPSKERPVPPHRAVAPESEPGHAGPDDDADADDAAGPDDDRSPTDEP